jgi:hypothetical protein
MYIYLSIYLSINIYHIYHSRTHHRTPTKARGGQELWHRLSLCVNGALQREDRMIISDARPRPRPGPGGLVILSNKLKLNGMISEIILYNSR